MKFRWIKFLEPKRTSRFTAWTSVRKIQTKRCPPSDLAEEFNRPHVPVMVEEVIEHLNLKPGNLFLDMTFGAGGHSLALLERIPQLRVIGLDRDPITEKYAKEIGARHPSQVTHLIGKFSELPELLNGIGIKQNSIDGILFDLGCSSMQFDNAERGFSISETGPLDMRMDSGRVPNSITAADVVAYASEKELSQIFKIYGEERRAKKIARAIEKARFTFSNLTTTGELRDLVETVCSDVRHDKLNRKAHTATKIFQALRIFVNNELNELNYGIELAHKYLKPGGRIVVLSFHSLEDVIAKRNFHNHELENNSESLPLQFIDPSKNFTNLEEIEMKKKFWEVVNKKVIVPKSEEVFNNPRSRSAKLRAAIKVEP